jgi:hypothetical protein
MRTQRLKLPWLLAVPFFYLADPRPAQLCAGAVLAAGGLLRGAAAGSIEKDRFLSIGGPYAYLRHPLYLGSFLLGSGFVVGGSRLILLVPFWFLFLLLYRRTVREEERFLESRFGDSYRSYRAKVPAVLPRSRRYQAGARGATGASASSFQSDALSEAGFRARLYLRNKEWQALLGAGVGFALLWAKAAWRG